MKTQPNDVVVGGAYRLLNNTVYVTAVKPKGRGWYVVYQPEVSPDLPTTRMGLEDFRRMAGVNQKEAA